MGTFIFKEVLSVRETTTVLDMPTWRVYSLIHKRQIRAYKDDNSNKWKIPTSSIEAYVQSMVAKSDKKLSDAAKISR